MDRANQATVEKAVSRILTEDIVSVTEARGELASLMRKRPDKATVIRWFRKGVGGVKLEHVRLGNQYFTSRQALTRFIAARTAAN